jgi:hypothetical protein
MSKVANAAIVVPIRSCFIISLLSIEETNTGFDCAP